MTQELLYIMFGLLFAIGSILCFIGVNKWDWSEGFIFAGICLAAFSFGFLVEGVTPYVDMLPSVKKQ